MKTVEAVLSNCMFFTSNRLSNILRKRAEEVFQPLGIGVPYVYLLVVVNQYDGISQTDLGQKLDIAPSTCTRFVDKLVNQGILRKEYEWKTAHVFLTDKGKEVCQGIDECICKLRQNNYALIGEKQTDNLTKAMFEACEMLSANKIGEESNNDF